MRYIFSLQDGREVSSSTPVLGIRDAQLIRQEHDAADVRAEASRRMQALVGARDAAHLDIIISNGVREAVRLLRVREERPWTAEEAARAATLQQVDTAIEAIRAASNAMESDPPSDYADATRWP